MTYNVLSGTLSL